MRKKSFKWYGNWAAKLFERTLKLLFLLYSLLAKTYKWKDILTESYLFKISVQNLWQFIIKEIYREKLYYSFNSVLLLIVTLCSIKRSPPQSVIIFILRIFLLNMLL